MPDLSMLYLFVSLITGLTAGYLLRGQRRPNLSKLSLGIILVLIFSLGFAIGSNNELLSALPEVGFSALGLAVFAIGFSVLFVVLVTRRLKIR